MKWDRFLRLAFPVSTAARGRSTNAASRGGIRGCTAPADHFGAVQFRAGVAGARGSRQERHGKRRPPGFRLRPCQRDRAGGCRRRGGLSDLPRRLHSGVADRGPVPDRRFEDGPGLPVAIRRDFRRALPRFPARRCLDGLHEDVRARSAPERDAPLRDGPPPGLFQRVHRPRPHVRASADAKHSGVFRRPGTITDVRRACHRALEGGARHWNLGGRHDEVAARTPERGHFQVRDVNCWTFLLAGLGLPLSVLCDPDRTWIRTPVPDAGAEAHLHDLAGLGPEDPRGNS